MSFMQVGSGPAGLIAALTLVKNGVPVRIIEKDAQHHIGSRGPGLQVSKCLMQVLQPCNYSDS